jgi:type II secretory pathway pseudopilin PulG
MAPFGQRAKRGAASRFHLERAGLTLLELLLVMGLLGVLLGAGVGLLSSINLGERAAVGLVQNVIRSARNAALARGAGAGVRLDVERGVLTARALEVVGTWHFESVPTLQGAFEIDGSAGGATLVDDGFVGKALGFPRGSQARALFPVHALPSFDFHDGFRIELALRVEDDGAGRVLRLGDSIGLDAGSRGALRAWFTQEAVDATGAKLKGGKIVLDAPPAHLDGSRWRRVCLDYDGQRFVLEVDGLEVARAQAEAPVWPVGDDLALGDERSGFVGALDALVIAAVSASEQAKLPDGVRLAPESPQSIHFDASGALDRARHADPLEVRLVFEQDGVVRTIRVGMYGTVE